MHAIEGRLVNVKNVDVACKRDILTKMAKLHALRKCVCKGTIADEDKEYRVPMCCLQLRHGDFGE